MVGVPLCCTTEEIPSTSFTISGGSLIIDLKKTPALANPGRAVKVVDVDRKINLIVVHEKRNHFVALDRSCTHGGAQVAYNRYNGTVQCSSWGHSEFALDGTLLGGSARRPLRSYKVQHTGDQLEIMLEVA
jgi:Rieske Fe-S protein